VDDDEIFELLLGTKHVFVVGKRDRDRESGDRKVGDR